MKDTKAGASTDSETPAQGHDRTASQRPMTADIVRPAPAPEVPGHAPGSGTATGPLLRRGRTPGSDGPRTGWPAAAGPLFALLDRHGLLGRARVVEGLLLTDIDTARTVLEEELDRHETAWRDGAVLPPVLVRSLPSGRHALIDGVHRAVAASRAGVATVPAVVVEDVDDGLAFVLSVEANTRHGIPLDRSMRPADDDR